MRLREGSTQAEDEVKHEIDGGDDRSYAYAPEAPSLGFGGSIHCRRIVARHVERVDGAGLDDGHNAERQAAANGGDDGQREIVVGLGHHGIGAACVVAKGGRLHFGLCVRVGLIHKSKLVY